MPTLDLHWRCDAGQAAKSANQIGLAGTVLAVDFTRSTELDNGLVLEATPK